MIASPYPAPEWVHFSNLKHIAKSPAHYRASLRAYEAQTRASPRSFGSLCHARTLGRGDFAVFEGEVRKGKNWTAFKLDNPGKDLVLRSEWDRAGVVSEKILAHPKARAMLEGDREVDVQWTTVTGRKCAGRIDCITPRGVTELKMSFTAEPVAFTFQAMRMLYIPQLAWYGGALERMGRLVDDLNIVACEPEAPFAITTFRLTDATRMRGVEIIREWLEKLRHAERTKRFAEYTDETIPLDIPDDRQVELVGFDDEDVERTEVLGQLAELARFPRAGEESELVFE